MSLAQSRDENVYTFVINFQSKYGKIVIDQYRLVTNLQDVNWLL